MSLQTAATMVRGVMMLATGALALWLLLSERPGDAFLGVILALLVACGFVVKTGRVRWYAMGVACVFTALFLGSVSGPLFEKATIGYCDSVLEPFEPGHIKMDDAPPGTYERCAEVRQQRIPAVGVFALAGLAGLAVSVRGRQLSTNTRDPLPSGTR